MASNPSSPNIASSGTLSTSVFSQNGTSMSTGKTSSTNNGLSGGLGQGMSPGRSKQHMTTNYIPKGNRNGGAMPTSMTHNVPYERSHTTEALPAHAIGSYPGSRGSGELNGSWLPAPAGILPELALSPQSRFHGAGFGSNGGGYSTTRSSHRDRRHHCGGGGGHRHPGFTPGSGGASNYGNLNRGAGSLVPSPTPSSLGLIQSMAGDALLFSETNMDWTKLNIFRTRLCDRLTQTHSCHMVNRCLFSHDVNWPRRTPFLPRATALTLRYIPVWCPRLEWPPLVGLCDSSGKISWTSNNENWDARYSHQNCARGDNCPFVHNLEEFLYHPEVYKTRSCCLANDDNFEEQMNNNCMALCPWYFCPFAHDIYELRDLRGTKYAWHPPPQIVDNQFVARTQGFDELEMQIIDFIRKAPNGASDLYTSPVSPLKKLWRDRMPPVIRPMRKSLIERLKPSNSHLQCQFDELLYVMIIASFLNLLLYPVENFYVPTLLSLQCALLRFQMDLPLQQYEAAWLVQQYDIRKMNDGNNIAGLNSPLLDESSGNKIVDNNETPSGTTQSGSPQIQPLMPSFQKNAFPYYPQTSSSIETSTPGGSGGNNGGGSNSSYSPLPSPAEMYNTKRHNFPMFQYLLADDGIQEGQHELDETPPTNTSNRPSGSSVRLETSKVEASSIEEEFMPVTHGSSGNDIETLSMPKNFQFDSDETPTAVHMAQAELGSSGISRPDERLEAGTPIHNAPAKFVDDDDDSDDLPPGVSVPSSQIKRLAERSNTNLLGTNGKEVNEELCAILELLEPEELLQMMELISASSPSEGASVTKGSVSLPTSVKSLNSGIVGEPDQKKDAQSGTARDQTADESANAAVEEAEAPSNVKSS